MENLSINSFALRVTAARFDYEYLLLSPQEISLKHRLPLASVEQEIQEAGWTPRVTVPATADTHPETSPSLSADLLSDTFTRLDVLEAYRIQEHIPYAIAVQKEILLKAYQMVQDFPTGATRNSVQALKTLHDMIDVILSKVPTSFTPQDASTSSQASPVQVLIQNNIQ